VHHSLQLQACSTTTRLLYCGQTPRSTSTVGVLKRLNRRSPWLPPDSGNIPLIRWQLGKSTLKVLEADRRTHERRLRAVVQTRLRPWSQRRGVQIVRRGARPRRRELRATRELRGVCGSVGPAGYQVKRDNSPRDRLCEKRRRFGGLRRRRLSHVAYLMRSGNARNPTGGWRGETGVIFARTQRAMTMALHFSQETEETH